MGKQRYPDDGYQHARVRARRRPAWWLRRRQAQIIGIRPRPTLEQIAELRALRQELHVRSLRRAPARWWIL